MPPALLDQLAQTGTLILGFLLFYFIMAKFAWPMILGTLDARQKKIEQGFGEIKALKTEAEQAQKRYEEQLRGIEAEARAKIQEAVADGKRVAAEMVEKARQSVGLEVAAARKQLQQDVVNLTLAATEKLLREKVDGGKDRDLVAAFVADMEKEG